jgi:hypothetical protein
MMDVCCVHPIADMNTLQRQHRKLKEQLAKVQERTSRQRIVRIATTALNVDVEDVVQEKTTTIFERVSEKIEEVMKGKVQEQIDEAIKAQLECGKVQDMIKDSLKVYKDEVHASLQEYMKRLETTYQNKLNLQVQKLNAATLQVTRNAQEHARRMSDENTQSDMDEKVVEQIIDAKIEAAQRSIQNMITRMEERTATAFRIAYTSIFDPIQGPNRSYYQHQHQPQAPQVPSVPPPQHQHQHEGQQQRGSQVTQATQAYTLSQHRPTA